MRVNLLVAVALLAPLGAGIPGVKERARAEAQSQDPKFVEGNKLVRPDGYREWIYLSSGLGMNYSADSQLREPQFTNVFV